MWSSSARETVQIHVSGLSRQRCHVATARAEVGRYNSTLARSWGLHARARLERAHTHSCPGARVQWAATRACDLLRLGRRSQFVHHLPPWACLRLHPGPLPRTRCRVNAQDAHRQSACLLSPAGRAVLGGQPSRSKQHAEHMPRRGGEKRECTLNCRLTTIDMRLSSSSCSSSSLWMLASSDAAMCRVQKLKSLAAHSGDEISAFSACFQLVWCVTHRREEEEGGIGGSSE